MFFKIRCIGFTSWRSKFSALLDQLLRHTFVPQIRYLGFITRGKKGPLTTTEELSACKSTWTLTRIYTIKNKHCTWIDSKGPLPGAYPVEGLGAPGASSSQAPPPTQSFGQLSKEGPSHFRGAPKKTNIYRQKQALHVVGRCWSLVVLRWFWTIQV
jgi:hypothetical protein